MQGGRGAGWVGSHEVAGKGYVLTKTSQMASIGVIFTSTYHTRQLNPWPNSSASRVVNYSQLSACQGDMLVSRSQTLFSRRGVIAFSISAPLEKGSGRGLQGLLGFHTYECVDYST